MRSASLSMAREKFSWFCITAAGPPIMMAMAASGLRVAARAPSSMEASISGVCLPCCAIMRAMWRWVMWLVSWAMTEASSSPLLTTPISPR